MSAVEWQHDRRQLIIPALIFSAESDAHPEGIQVSALVDTGSTTSGLTLGIAQRLRLVGRGKRPLKSARNEEQVQRYTFRIGLLPDPEDGHGARYPYVFDELMGFELRNSFAFQALIGMDVLSGCDLSLDRTGRCRLVFG